ncbi:hypothetical protein OV090_46080 [Nannocystis sp. RBIL2]|uniref:hypothetical protein n=1 Tax=Nannocystis sp. RBIL2 TaxID=2996788 RepID=UPI0022701524|nr:hypothetical protein [Nannocystis sp. RBIL2]MCY1072203.1 hypothetical protein [Nannocystis sp. RBIL2]
MRSPQQPRSRDRARRSRVAVAFGGLLGLLPARAPAMPTIGWEAPAGCPSAERVVARIGEVVGARPVSPAVSAVRARVERQGGGWLLVVVFSGRDGSTERRLTLHDCEATANATALLVGIALVGPASGAAPEEIPLAVPVPEAEARDREGRVRAGEAGAGSAETGGEGRERAGATGARPAETGGEGRERAADGTQARGRAADGMQARGRAADGVGGGRPRAFVQVGPALAVGVLPRATAGLAAGLGVAWSRLRVALGYAGWFRSPARWAEDPQIGAELALHAGALRVGPVRRVGPVELQAALGLEFGALRAAGVGSEVNLERRTWWGATLVGGGLAWAPRALRGHGALLIQAELVVPLHRPTLLYNREPIFRFGAVGLRAGLQLEARFF